MMKPMLMLMLKLMVALILIIRPVKDDAGWWIERRNGWSRW